MTQAQRCPERRNDGASTTPDDIIAFCKDRMAAYKHPRVVEILDEIPKTATGRMLRRELRNLED